jgi:hypothetical protein
MLPGETSRAQDDPKGPLAGDAASNENASAAAQLMHLLAIVARRLFAGSAQFATKG